MKSIIGLIESLKDDVSGSSPEKLNKIVTLLSTIYDSLDYSVEGTLPANQGTVTLEDEKSKAQEVVEEKKEEDKKVEVKEEIVVTPEPNLFYDRAVIKTEVGTITGYGPDCAGCSGITASGHNLHESIYYNDLEFGTVRILAADKSIPFYSIFRVSNIPGMDPFLAIVLDTGGNVGYGKGTLFDLAHANEQNGVLPKTSNVTFEMLRSGK